MAGNAAIDRASLKEAVIRFCDDKKPYAYSIVGDGERKDQFRLMCDGNPEDTDLFLWEENGKPKCVNVGGEPQLDFLLNFMEYLKPVESPRKATSQTDKAIMPPKPRNAVGGPLAKPGTTVRDIQVAELTFDDIRQFLCPAASDKDTFMFLKLCQARNLNPFTGEVFLIPYKDNKTQEIKCSMVVGKEAFMRKAEANSQYRGFKAGIIVSKGEEIFYREGTFQRKGEALEGGWCEVYRADRDQPIRAEVSLVEYDQGHGLWSRGKKATMIRKVAVVSGHREAFPSDTSGMYGAEELGIDDSKEIKAEVPT